MPNISCAVYKCYNNGGKLQKYRKGNCIIHGEPKGVCGCPMPYKHFKFPADHQLKEKWIMAINRRKSSTNPARWTPQKDSVVCSSHFVDGEPTVRNPIPTLNLGYMRHKEIRKPRTKSTRPMTLELPSLSPTIVMETAISPVSREVENWMALPEDPDSNISVGTSQQSDAITSSADDQGNIKNIQRELDTCKQQLFRSTLSLKAKMKRLAPFLAPVHKRLIHSDDSCNFYTNIPKMDIFYALCDYIAKAEHRRKFTVTTSQKYRRCKMTQSLAVSKLTTRDEILLVLMKLRLSLLNKDLADRFLISLTTTSNIINRRISQLAVALAPLIVFPTRKEVASTIPSEYGHYPKLRCIIDCTEFFIQKPLDLQLQAATWSDYKHHNTLKCLVAITPQGSICFISDLWGGRASDRYIVTHSKFLDNIHPGDQVLADRGFTVREELMMRGAELVLPPANRGKSQFTSADIEKTKKVANVRIHVERVIQRLKNFRILSQVIPISLAGKFNDVLAICSGITNMKGPIVKSWTDVIKE